MISNNDCVFQLPGDVISVRIRKSIHAWSRHKFPFFWTKFLWYINTKTTIIRLTAPVIIMIEHINERHQKSLAITIMYLFSFIIFCLLYTIHHQLLLQIQLLLPKISLNLLPEHIELFHTCLTHDSKLIIYGK